MFLSRSREPFIGGQLLERLIKRVRSPATRGGWNRLSPCIHSLGTCDDVVVVVGE